MASFVVFDTNIIENHFEPDADTCRRFRIIADKLGLRVAIPHAVFEELVNHRASSDTKDHNKELDGLLRLIRDDARGISPFKPLDRTLHTLLAPLQGIAKIEIGSEKEIRSSILKRLELMFGRAVEIIPLARVGHAEIIGRCIAKKRPFHVISFDEVEEETDLTYQPSTQRKKKKVVPKDAGYKDTMVWLSIVEFLKTHPEHSITLLTNDSDFLERPADKKDSTIHSDLQADLEQVAGGSERFRCFRTLPSFNEANKKELEHDEKLLERLQNLDFDALVWRSKALIEPQLANVEHSFPYSQVAGAHYSSDNPILISVEDIVLLDEDLWSVKASCSQVITVRSPQIGQADLAVAWFAYLGVFNFTVTPSKPRIDEATLLEGRQEAMQSLVIKLKPVNKNHWEIEVSDREPFQPRTLSFKDRKETLKCLRRLRVDTAGFDLDKDESTSYQRTVPHSVLRMLKIIN